MFEIKIVTDFSAAHSLRDYPGSCKNVHGHNWKVEVILSAMHLDPIGISMDFRTLRAETERLLDEMDHTYLNEHPPFHTLNPTAENIAQWIFQSLSKSLHHDHARVNRINVWENERSCASYFEQVSFP